MKILFVHEVNWHRKVIYEIHDYPELLSRAGHDVTFVDFPEGVERHGLARVFDWRTTTVSAAARAHEGAAVTVVTPGGGPPPPLDRPGASLTQVPVLRRLLRDGGFDAAVIYAVPTNGWQAVGLARRYGVPTVFRSIDLPHALRPTPFVKAIEWAERFIVSRVEVVSTHNVALARRSRDLGAAPDAVRVDYPGLDLERFSPGAAPTELRRRYGLEPHHRVALFMGTLYRFAGLDGFLEQIAPHLRAHPEFRVVLVGDGEARATLASLTTELGIDKSVVFTGRADYDVLADHLRLADVAINPFRPEPVTHHALPGKVLQYLGCGTPAVSTPLEGLQGMIPDGDGVIYRPPGAEFAGAVVDLLTDDERRLALGVRARAIVEQLCDWDRAVDRFTDTITLAIARHRPR